MITLVLGGTRSGKSAVAESIVTSLAAGSSAEGPERTVTYIATATVDPADADHRTRIDAHRRRRPESWITLECSTADDLVTHLREVRGIVLVDSIGTWISAHHDLVVDHSDLIDALISRTEPTVLVSEEVGLAVHAPSELGRRFVDAVGTLNQAIAEVADQVMLVVAGRVIDLPPSSC